LRSPNIIKYVMHASSGFKKKIPIAKIYLPQLNVVNPSDRNRMYGQLPFQTVSKVFSMAIESQEN
jgi:hypothetical protein